MVALNVAKARLEKEKGREGKILPLFCGSSSTGNGWLYSSSGSSIDVGSAAGSISLGRWCVRVVGSILLSA